MTSSELRAWLLRMEIETGLDLPVQVKGNENDWESIEALFTNKQEPSKIRLTHVRPEHFTSIAKQRNTILPPPPPKETA